MTDRKDQALQMQTGKKIFLYKARSNSEQETKLLDPRWMYYKKGLLYLFNYMPDSNFV